MSPPITDVYEFEEILGEGGFSSVVLASHNESKKRYAVKLIDKSKILDDVQRQRIDREIAILKTCNHPNIVKLVETYESDDEISLVMELMQGGDLFDRITSKGIFTEEEARDAMYSIISSVDYLHDRSLVHRDIKPENLLYTTKDNQAILKLTDFGLSKHSNELEGLETPCGTIAYTAPEVTHNKLYRKGVDVWSCGCILYFMLFGRPPFYSDNDETIFELVSEGKWKFPERPRVSESAKQLVEMMLEKDPSRRCTAKQALSHPWITKQSQRPLLTTSPPHSQIFSSPMKIASLRASFDSAMEAERGPLTPPLLSPLESPLWKKRAERKKAKQNAAPPRQMIDEDSSDGDDGNMANDLDTDDGLDMEMEMEIMEVLS